MLVFCLRSRVPVHATCGAECRHAGGNERYCLLQQLALVSDTVARAGE